MAKRLQEYIKYSTTELDQYAQTEGSCVRKINTDLHFSLGPFCLANFKQVLMEHILRKKVGSYDVHLDGIVLDVKKIKVLGTNGAIRADDPRIHIDVNADVFVFKPEEGAELTGVVKHIGLHQVGVILYRVFSVNLRVVEKVDKSEVQMDQEVKFRIRKYNLQNVFPYIDGELLMPETINLTKGNKIVFKQEDNADSGIEEKYNTQEFDGLLSSIKTEAPSEYEVVSEESYVKKSKKKEKANEIAESPLKSAHKKSHKKRRKRSSISSVEDAEISSTNLVKKIRHELTFSDDSVPFTHKKIKTER